MPISYRTIYLVNPGKRPAKGMLDSIEYIVPAKNFISAVSFVADKLMKDCPGLEQYSDIKEVMLRIKELGTYEAVFGGEPEVTPSLEGGVENGELATPEAPVELETPGPPTV